MSLLKKANACFKRGEYAEAYQMYLQLKKSGHFPFVDFNIELCKKKLSTNTQELANIHKKEGISTVDIIIPIYNAIDDVKKCIDSLYEHKTHDFNVIAIDDCSDDETRIYLENESKKRDFTLLRNRENLRFTKTVNRGFKESHGDYVVLLNSDTIVTPRWIEKILACFASDEKIGIVGPLSNAASWQTVPVRDDKEFGGWLVNEIPEGYSVEDMGMLVETVSQKLYPKVPSVNGFCYVIKREVLDKNGALDEEYFPTGYGEEDDFSIRAIDAGFKIAVADDTYIFHAKSKSYTHEVRAVLSVKGRKALDAKHGKVRLKELVNNWKVESTLPRIAKNVESYMQVSTGNKKVVYTAIFGNYDSIKEPEYINDDWDYICFTNNKNLKSELFTVKYVDSIFDNQTKNARMIKILSHIFLIGYDYSLWIDGNVKLRGRNIEELVKNNQKNDYISLHKHVKRNCIFEEVQACINAKKDNSEIMLKQLLKYEQEGMPKNLGLVETAEILRQQNNKNTKQLNFLWWKELNNNSIRDQLSFNYVCWKNNFHYSIMEGIQWLDPYFNIYKHGSVAQVKQSPKVTIIIVIEKQSSLIIEEMINKIISITKYPKYNIILTNTRRSLEIDNILNSLKNRFKQVDIMGSCKGKSVVDAKNYIAFKIKFDYLCFMDENCSVIENNWLELMVNDLLLNECAVMAGATILDQNYNILSSSVQIKHKNGLFIEAKNRTKLGGTGNVYAVSEKCVLIDCSTFKENKGFSNNFESRNTTIDFSFRLLSKNLLTRYILNVQIIDKKTPLSEKEQLISSHDLRAKWGKSTILGKDLKTIKCKKKTKLCIIPQFQGNGFYTATGFIRLVYPYQSFNDRYEVNIVKDIKEAIALNPNTIVIQRYSITIDELKKIKKLLKYVKIIYDIDDDLIEHFKDNKIRVETIKYLMTNSDLVTVSTNNLLLEYQKYNSNIKKIDNFLNLDIWKFTNKEKRQLKTINVLYMGSKSHYDDFLLVKEELVKLKKHYGDKISIDIIGVMPKELYMEDNYFNYIIPPENARNSYPKFVKWLVKENKWHIGIAPLEDNIFNNKKSYIKFLDYSALGLVTVASNLVPYVDVIKDKFNGVLVDKNKSWFDTLSNLINKPDEVEKLSLVAHKEFIESHTLKDYPNIIKRLF